MVCPDQRDAAAALLRTLGFRIGRSDDHDASVAELDRTLLAVHALYPDHLPRFVGATTDPSVRYVEVDVACSLTWATSDYHVPLGAPFDALCEVGSPCADSALLTFPPAYQFLDAAMHLFREAFVGLPNGRGSASWATLSAFVDIRLLCRRYGAAMRASGLPEEVSGLGAPVAWVLAHTDRLFGTGHLAGLGLAAFADEDWIASWRPAGMACQRWHGDMRRRLRDGGELRWTPPG
jgi:hypothetical protein